MQKNENPVVLSLVLLIISVLVALLLSFTNSITKEKISENKVKEQNEALFEVLPDAKDFEKVEFGENELVKTVYEAKSGNTLVGYCVNVTPSGYGGVLDIMVGINSDMTLSGIKIVSHSETPGLGAKSTDESFTNQFENKKTDVPLGVIKSGTPKDNEIVAISGATITSTAVKNGVNAAIDAARFINGGV